MADTTAGIPPRYLRTQEAARFLGLSERTLEKHRTYGTGPAYRKLGGRVATPSKTSRPGPIAASSARPPIRVARCSPQSGRSPRIAASPAASRAETTCHVVPSHTA